jgi:antitoxin component YwqK of YwqJK toxin-antitoxin module
MPSHQELEDFLLGYFSGQGRANYGISLINFAADLSSLDVELRFLSGETYCCAEPGCHFGTDLSRFIARAAESGIVFPDGLEMRGHFVVEQGVRLANESSPHVRTISKAYEYDHVIGGKAAANKMRESVAWKPPAGFTGLWIVESFGGEHSETEYVDGIANGISRRINENGVCTRECTMKDGQRHGTLITRDANGTVLDTSEFIDGTGIYRIFNAAGRLRDEIPLIRGKSHGLAKRWRGGWIGRLQYVDDKLVAIEWEPPAD